MVKIKKLDVKSFDLDHLDVFWEIDRLLGPTSDSKPHAIYDYEFNVFRSEAAMGPYVQVGGPFRDVYHFRDVNISLMNKFRNYFYKLEVVHRPTGEKTEFGPSSHSIPGPDLIAAEINRQEDLLFREFIGRKCVLYPVRTFGPSCSCFDAVMRRQTRSNHGACYGTGWLGGYHSPVMVYVQIDPNPKESQPTSLMELQSSDTTGRMISFPPVSPGDILIESENRRWRVSSVSQTQRLRSVVRQELKLHEIPKGDIEYALPVRLDLATHEPSARRNYTNPHNVEGEDLSDIFSVYGGPKGSLR